MENNYNHVNMTRSGFWTSQLTQTDTFLDRSFAELEKILSKGLNLDYWEYTNDKDLLTWPTLTTWSWVDLNVVGGWWVVVYQQPPGQIVTFGWSF